MKKLLFTVALLIYFNTMYAQSSPKDTVTINKDSIQKVEIEASVSMEEWKEHLSTALQPFIERAARKGMKKGTYIVQVHFLVEKDGSITNVVALNDPGYGLAKGCEQVVKSGPNWRPGMVNGRPVRSYHTQPIGFVIAEK